MKRTVAPLAMPLQALSERPRRLVNPEILEYFRDVSDHVVESVSRCRASTNCSPRSARLSVSENEDVRKISASVANAAVPTMIAGIYGMNFEMMPNCTSGGGIRPR